MGLSKKRKKQSTPYHQFLEILKDEEDSGSELEYMQEDDEMDESDAEVIADNMAPSLKKKSASHHEYLDDLENEDEMDECDADEATAENLAPSLKKKSALYHEYLDDLEDEDDSGNELENVVLDDDLEDEDDSGNELENVVLDDDLEDEDDSGNELENVVLDDDLEDEDDSGNELENVVLDDDLEDEDDSGNELENVVLDDDLDECDADEVTAENLMDVRLPVVTIDDESRIQLVSVRSPTPPPARTPSPGSTRSLTPPQYSPQVFSSVILQQAQAEPNERVATFYSTIEVKVEEVKPEETQLKQGLKRKRDSGARGGAKGHRRRRIACGGEGGPILELYSTDDDVPLSLRKMILEQARGNARTDHEMKKRKKVTVNDDDSEDEDEYCDAESSIVKELFDGDSSVLTFEWAPTASFQGVEETFKPEGQPGARQKTKCPYEAFRQYWDDDILEHIVRETNRYASELKSQSQKFAQKWYDTNLHEILTLFAFWIMLGIIRMPSINSCYSNNSLLKTSVFRTLLTETRYWMLNRALHFANNATRTSDSSKLFSLGPIVDHLSRNFMQAYIPHQNIAIHESLILWNGRDLSCRQYGKTNAARFGIKSYELCDSVTGYLWSFIIHQGNERGASSSVLPKSIEVVVKLVRPLLNKGYRLFLDNWCNSPILARFLKRNRTDCVGTLKRNRKNVPHLIKLVTIPEGTCVARHSGDVVVMAYQDKKTVYTISTFHGTDYIEIPGKHLRPAHSKPTVIADYSKSIGGTNRKDQMLEPYLIERKSCLKWYKKIFKKLLNVSILNSFIVVNSSTEDSQLKLDFRLELVEKIIQKHLTHVPQPRRRLVSNKKIDVSEARLIDEQYGHFLVRRSRKNITNGGKLNKRNRRYCVWCAVREKRNKGTAFLCDKCDVPLCVDECFKKYHTVP